MEARVTWTGDMSFDGHQDGHVVPMDVEGRGSKPKTLLLTALGGCTAMDVVSILKKMQVPLEGCEVQAAAELTEEHPKVFTAIRLRYVFRGKGLPMEKLQRAVSLSQEKYCGVSAMLAKACPISWEIAVED